MEAEKTQEQIMREQEEMLMKRYGGLKPKKALVAPNNQKAYFDSADWAMQKEQEQHQHEPGHPAPPHQVQQQMGQVQQPPLIVNSRPKTQFSNLQQPHMENLPVRTGPLVPMERRLSSAGAEMELEKLRPH